MSPDDVERRLGPLVTVDDAQRWLVELVKLTAAGRLSGTASNSCVRAVEIFLRSLEAKLHREEYAALKAEVDRMKSGRMMEFPGMKR